MELVIVKTSKCMQYVSHELLEVQYFHTTPAAFHLCVFWNIRREESLFGSRPNLLPSEQFNLCLFSQLVFHEMNL